MKKHFFILFILLTIAEGNAQRFINGTYQWDGRNRKYTYHIPDMYYTEGKPVPLVLGLHGFGDNIINFRDICITNIADTANFICVYPEALVFSPLGSTCWNSGATLNGTPFNKDVDDLGFLNSLLDTMISKYNIDTNRIYVFGFSFGAFMSHRLAAELNHRVTAAAAVSGLVGNKMTAIPARGIPILYFHGTADATINYFNCPYGLLPPKTVDFWVKNNLCDTMPLIDTVPNTANDGRLLIHHTYPNGRDNSVVEFYKVINGEHEWLGLPDNDISYCQTIWKFFRPYTLAKEVSTPIRSNVLLQIRPYPNPTSSLIFLPQFDSPRNLSITSTTGQLMMNILNFNNQSIDISSLARGVYLLQIEGYQSVQIMKE